MERKQICVNEGADRAFIEKVKSLEKILSKVNELDSSIVDFEDKFEQDKKLAKDVISVKRYVEQLLSRAKEDVKKSGAGLNY